MKVDKDKYITRKEAAKIFECAPTTFWSWALDGRAPGKCFKVGCTDYYNKQALLDFKSTGGIVRFKTGRKKGYKVIPSSVEEDTDPWMVRRAKPCFEYKEMYIHFMQPALMNRKVTIDALLGKK